MATSLSIFSTGSLASTVHGSGPTQASVCVAFLKQVMNNELWRRPDHITGVYTENSFRTFRGMARLRADVRGGIENVFIRSSTERTEERERLLSQRVSGLLHDFESFRLDPAGTRQGLSFRQEQIGISIADIKEIKLFFDAVRRVQVTIEERVRYLAASTPGQRVAVWVARLTRIFATMGSLANLAAGDVQGMLGWVAAWYLTTFIDHPLVGRVSEFEEKITEFMKLSEAPGWAYWGMSVEVPGLTEFPSLNRETEERVFAQMASRSDVRIRNKHLSPLSKSGSGVISIDLLMENRDGSSPELHIVVRATSGRPDYPRRPKPREDLELHPLLEPGLIPAPAGPRPR